MIKTNRQRPIETDAQFRYVCPNLKCGFDYWLTLKECQTKNFKIVCDCGEVFRPKRILKISIVYSKNKSSITTDSQQKPVDHSKQDLKETINKKPIPIPEYLKIASIKILCGYGFTESESENFVIKGFETNPVDNVAIFVKYIIENIKLLETEND